MHAPLEVKDHLDSFWIKYLPTHCCSLEYATHPSVHELKPKAKHNFSKKKQRGAFVENMEFEPASAEVLSL